MPAYPLTVQSDRYLDQCEVKFLPDALAARVFWAIATQHLAPEAEVAPQAYARTTYFDTPDLAYYRSRGSRLRVREYAQAATSSALPVTASRCYLELKQSADGRRTKTRLALRSDEVAAELATLSGPPLTPCVATMYRRRALVDDSGALRVTLDDRILLCRPRPLGSPFADFATADVIARGPAFVLEYKAWGAPPPWLVRALAGLDEAIGFTKFILGMDAIAHAARGMDRRLLSVVSCTG